MPLLFSYGTLQQEAVQISTFGRRLRGEPDELVGFEQSMFRIEDPELLAGRPADHAIVRFHRAPRQPGEGHRARGHRAGPAGRPARPAGYGRILRRSRPVARRGCTPPREQPRCEGSRDCVGPSGSPLRSWWLRVNHQRRGGGPDGRSPECPDYAAQSRKDRRRAPCGATAPGRPPRISRSASPRCASGWAVRGREGGRACTIARAGRAAESGRHPGPLVDWVERLRRQRWTGTEIAARLQVGRATVARLLHRRGLGRLRSLDPPPPARRYQWAHPGDLVHLDVKKLGRIGRVGHRITGDRRPASGASAGSTSTWPSMMPRAWPTSRSSGPSGRRRSPRSSARAGLVPASAASVRRIMTDNAFAYRARRCRRSVAPPAATSPDPALHAAHQRQGRAVHPDPAPRVGLPSPLFQLGGSHSRAAGLAPLLQLAPAPCQSSR